MYDCANDPVVTQSLSSNVLVKAATAHAEARLMMRSSALDATEMLVGVLLCEVFVRACYRCIQVDCECHRLAPIKQNPNYIFLNSILI